jgi:hypothetical protein
MPVVALLMTCAATGNAQRRDALVARKALCQYLPDGRVALALDHDDHRPIDELHAELLALPGVQRIDLIGVWSDEAAINLSAESSHVA